MKPLHIILLLWALFITFLADGISWVLLPIPALGIPLALAICFCINATMGAGLLLVLVSNGMWHPTFGPAATILGLVPPFNLLPMWLGLVFAGIVHDLGNERGMLGEVAKLADNIQSAGNPIARGRGVFSTYKNMTRLAEGRPPQAEGEPEPRQEKETERRVLPDLKSPSIVPHINNDIVANQPYANAA